MTEILTESFCERCGTRYTFESSAPRLSRIGRVRTFSRGVKNFVMSDEASFSEALADARGEEELATTTHQLDAFHKTFNFCLTCRQYTCGDCWNVADGRCLTCAPMDGPAPLAFTAPAATMAAGATAATNGHAAPPADENLWPEADLSQERLARALGDQPPVAEDVVQDEVASQLEVDAAAQAFEAPELAEAEDALPDPSPMSVDDAWAAAAAAQAEGAEGHGTFTFDDEVAGRGHGGDALAAAEAVRLADVEPAAEEMAPIAGAGEPGADFDAQASAAEQDATAEAAMDPDLDFDIDVDGMDSVPGQSLEDAIAAYEARLAAGEQPAAGASLQPEVELAGAAALEVAHDDAPLDAEPVAFETEPVVEDLWADLDQTVAAAAFAAAATEFDDAPPVAEVAASPESVVVEAEPVDAHAEPERDDHELALAAFAAAALAAEPRDEEPVYAPSPSSPQSSPSRHRSCPSPLRSPSPSRSRSSSRSPLRSPSPSRSRSSSRSPLRSPSPSRSRSSSRSPLRSPSPSRSWSSSPSPSQPSSPSPYRSGARCVAEPEPSRSSSPSPSSPSPSRRGGRARARHRG